jgi:hypothetical protein
MGTEVEVTLEVVAVAGEVVAVMLDAITIDRLKLKNKMLPQPTPQQSSNMTHQLRPSQRNPLSLMEIVEAARVGASVRGAPIDWQPQRRKRLSRRWGKSRTYTRSVPQPAIARFDHLKQLLCPHQALLHFVN